MYFHNNKMNSNERVVKFQEDADKLLQSVDITNNKSIQKIISEIGKLKTWLQKHQNDLLQDPIKGKLFHIVENYFHFSMKHKAIEDLLDQTQSLISDLLQMPEGKLISAKDKKKALNWHSSISLNPTKDTQIINSRKTRWYLEGITDSKFATLLNVDNEELWKENFQVDDIALFNELKRYYENGIPLIIELDESTQTILQIQETEA